MIIIPLEMNTSHVSVFATTVVLICCHVTVPQTQKTLILCALSSTVYLPAVRMR